MGTTSYDCLTTDVQQRTARDDACRRQTPNHGRPPTQTSTTRRLTLDFSMDPEKSPDIRGCRSPLKSGRKAAAASRTRAEVSRGPRKSGGETTADSGSLSDQCTGLGMWTTSNLEVMISGSCPLPSFRMVEQCRPRSAQRVCETWQTMGGANAWGKFGFDGGSIWGLCWVDLRST